MKATQFLRAEGSSIQEDMDMSIGDTANLQEAIAVRSVQKENPHTCGICYSSSRAPSATNRKLKGILLRNCTDLKRDANMQGAGRPNLLKMLLQG